MVICKCCGAELKPNSKFCPECGTIIEKAAASEDETVKSSDSVPKPVPDEKTDKASSAENPADTEKKADSEIKSESKSSDDTDSDIEKTIEAAAEAAANLPHVKEISIIKPKDISVLKPKKAEVIQKKNTAQPPTAAKDPSPAALDSAPVADNTEHNEKAAAASDSKTDIPPKKVIPDVELPDEPKMDVEADESSLPSVSSFINKRDEDFGKDFYSDSSVKNKPTDQKQPKQEKPSVSVNEAAAAPVREDSNRRKFPIGAVIAIIVILAAAAAVYYLYSQGYFNGSSDSVTVAETTAYSETANESAADSAESIDTAEITSEGTAEELSSEESDDTETITIEMTSSGGEAVGVSDTETEIVSEAAEAELSEIQLAFTHTQSVGGSEILNYTPSENNGDGFSLSRMTEASQVIIDYSASISAGANVSPVNMYISDGNAKELVAASSVTETQVIYDYSAINDTAEIVGFADGINGITSISFSGVGFPVDITSITVTNCISQK